MREGEVAVSSGSMLWNRTGTWRYLRPVYREKTPPCAARCPAGEDVEGHVSLVAQGRTLEAFSLILSANPFPATCGRVCFHPCESACSRAALDGAVSIRRLERATGDAGLAAGVPMARPVAAPPHAGRVAVVGSGPAGLSAAMNLVLMGHRAVVFDAHPVPGGVPRVGIPAYRLPREVVDAEVARVAALGVEIRTGVSVDRDRAEALLQEFDAIVLAAGAPLSRTLGVPGEDGPGVVSGVGLLREVAFGGTPRLGRRVVVVGGGNTAIDAARTALRLGASTGATVTIAYRRSRAEMPAFGDEVAAAEAEGVAFRFLAAPTEVLREGGRVSGLRGCEVTLGEPDASGRRRPLLVRNRTWDFQADTVVVAAGEEIDASVLPDGVAVEDGIVRVDPSGRTDRQRVYAAGDVASWERSVPAAVGAGRRVARAIDADLRGRGGADAPVAPEVVDRSRVRAHYFRPHPRSPDGWTWTAPADFRETEVVLGAEAAAEARRCIHCGLCTACDNCYVFCPERAVLRGRNGALYVVDYDHCKGCGVCAEECPRAVIDMVKEEVGRP